MKAQQILSIDRVFETMYIHGYDATETSANTERKRDAVSLRLRQRPTRLPGDHPILRLGLPSRRPIHRPVRPAARSLALQDRHASAVGRDSFHRSHHPQPHAASAPARKTDRAHSRLRPPRAIPATHRRRPQATQENAAQLAARSSPPAQKPRRKRLESDAKTFDPRRGGHSASVNPPCPKQSIPGALAFHSFAAPCSPRRFCSARSLFSTVSPQPRRKFRFKIAAACSPFQSAPAIAC